MIDSKFHHLIPLIANLLRYFLLAGIPFLIFYKLFPAVFSKNKIQAQLAKQKDFIREILHSIQTSVIIAAVAILIIKTPLKEFTLYYEDLSAYPSWWIPISMFLMLVLHDTYFYWMHRWVHHPKVYRRVHLLHHKSVNPSPWGFLFLQCIREYLGGHDCPNHSIPGSGPSIIVVIVYDYSFRF